MSYRLKKYLLLFLIGSIVNMIPVCLAQTQHQENIVLKPEIKFDHYTMADGLSSSMVYCMAQDQKGFM